MFLLCYQIWCISLHVQYVDFEKNRFILTSSNVTLLPLWLKDDSFLVRVFSAALYALFACVHFTLPIWLNWILFKFKRIFDRWSKSRQKMIYFTKYHSFVNNLISIPDVWLLNWFSLFSLFILYIVLCWTIMWGCYLKFKQKWQTKDYSHCMPMLMCVCKRVCLFITICWLCLTCGSVECFIMRTNL